MLIRLYPLLASLRQDNFEPRETLNLHLLRVDICNHLIQLWIDGVLASFLDQTGKHIGMTELCRPQSVNRTPSAGAPIAGGESLCGLTGL